MTCVRPKAGSRSTSWPEQPTPCAVAARPYAVVVTDRSMPDMDGLELALAIRKIDAHAVLMLLTADAEPVADKNGSALLFQVLTKPCRTVAGRALGSGHCVYDSCPTGDLASQIPAAAQP